MYKRIILKLSGEALGANGDTLDQPTLARLAEQIRTVRENGTEVGVVVGGGNFVRGRTLSALGTDRSTADRMGMLGTVINALALQAALRQAGVKALAMSAFQIDGVTKFDRELALKVLEEGGVLVFGGGVANPYFSTDSGAALRACELGAEAILMAKNGVDGVYSADPAKDPTAVRYAELTFNAILEKDLKVIDSTAAGLCRDNGVNIFVFDMNEEGNIIKAAAGEAVGTLIHGGKE